MSLSGLPVDTTQVLAQLRLGGAQSDDVASFEVQPDKRDDDGRYSFGLRLPTGLTGRLQIGVGALRDAGSATELASGKRCLLATGFGDVALVAAGQPTLTLDLTTGPVACNGDLPILQRLVPEVIDNQVRLVLEGFGFAPEARVQIAEQELSFVVNQSPTRLATDQGGLDPATVCGSAATRSGACEVPVKIALPSGALSNTQPLLLSLIRFSEPTAPAYRATAKAGTAVYAAAIAEDLNGDGKVDLAVAGNLEDGSKQGSGFVDVFLNNGSGFLPPQRSELISDKTAVDPARITATSLCTTQTRGQSYTDLVVGIVDDTGRGGYVTLQVQGNGSYAASPIQKVVLTTSLAGTTDLVHVDVNPAGMGNDHRDLVLLTHDTSGRSILRVLLSDAAYNLGTTSNFDAGLGKTSGRLLTADLNSDGRLDFAVIASGDLSPELAKVRTVLNYGDGKIYPSLADGDSQLTLRGFGGGLALVPIPGLIHKLVVATSYVLPAASIEDSMQVLLNAENRSMRSSNPNPPTEPTISLLPQSYQAGARPASITAAPFDVDNALDLAISLTGDDSQSTRIVLLRNLTPAEVTGEHFPRANGRADLLPTLTLFGMRDDALLLNGNVDNLGRTDLIAVVRGNGAAQRPGAVWIFRNLNF